MTLLDWLTALSALVGLSGALLIESRTRRYRTAVEEHSSFLEARAAELEQFAGRVAHDIRNPLASAAMAAQLVVAKAADPHQRGLAEKIVRSLERATAITSGLLDFARCGAQPDLGAATSPAETVADLATGFSAELDALGISLTIEPILRTHVACSTGVYLSLLGNLLRNAIKYMGEASTRRIVVRVTPQGDSVMTEVTDTGPGIAPDKLPSLFNLYFRADKTGQEGLGLGLATVRKLVEGHGGRVGVSSEVGHGSTFWFLLPRLSVSHERSDDGAGAPAAAPRR